MRLDDAEDVPAVTRDPHDDYLVALARASAADVLVPGDRDLLDREVAAVEVLAPREFVERLDACDQQTEHLRHHVLAESTDGQRT